MSEPNAFPAPPALHPAFRAIRALLARQGAVPAAVDTLFDDARCGAFWEAAAGHLRVMIAAGSTEDDAAAQIVGALTVPVLFGHDARGSFNRMIRRKVNMQRRKKAAMLARELAKLLRDISREPMPPDGIYLLSLVPGLSNYTQRVPSYFETYPTADALATLALGLETPPDFAGAPGLASQKPTWRDWLREAKENLADISFTLSESDAIALVGALAEAGGVMRPSRESVHAALRPM